MPGEEREERDAAFAEVRRLRRRLADTERERDKMEQNALLNSEDAQNQLARAVKAEVEAAEAREQLSDAEKLYWRLAGREARLREALEQIRAQRHVLTPSELEMICAAALSNPPTSAGPLTEEDVARAIEELHKPPRPRPVHGATPEEGTD